MPCMTRAERLAAILELLVGAGRVDVDEAAEQFGVSTATIRRDLDHLADQQLLSRTHGGAVPNSTSYDLPMRYKTIGRHPAKAKIAERAVSMLWPGCTVALNGGTTTVEVARAIATADALHSGVTVVTNALNIATELTVRPFIKIVVCGGVARPQSYELVGSLAGDTMSQLTTDICFLGAAGVDPLGGITIADEAEAPVNRVMVTQAKRAYVVADASKLGEVAFFRICQLAEITGVITDAAADPALVAAMRDSGIEVLLA
ncbi:DeoR/GlpR family DNA-binding transcription regulator [Microlunatus ginsengisoli]|uniref:DeoR/GlpR family DNA-binding transcription regulator n=2 Tax=Microlunatus ginsengisoli TaxID=363863 RepID=A0ABP6ZIU7_9ACTN